MILLQVIFFLAVQWWFISYTSGFIVSMICGAIVLPVVSNFLFRYVIRMLSQGLFAVGMS